MSGTPPTAGPSSLDAPEVRRWLDARLSEIPAALAGAVRSLLAGSPVADPEGGAPEAMADGALVGLERVAGGGAARDRALELLAADALLTYAFEAAAEPALGGSAAAAAALADRVGPAGRLGRRAAGEAS